MRMNERAGADHEDGRRGHPGGTADEGGEGAEGAERGKGGGIPGHRGRGGTPEEGPGGPGAGGGHGHGAHVGDGRGARGGGGPGGGHSHGGHGHDHGGTEDLDWDTMGDVLERSAEVHSPFHTSAAAWLGGLVPGGPGAVRDVLDAGSGPGVVTSVLAEAFPASRVLALDRAPALLERARSRADRLGFGDRVRTLHAGLPEGLDRLDPVDLVWTGQVVHHLGDQVAALRGLGALLRPGGLIAVVEGGLPARYLPRDIGFGRPGLHARLDAAAEDWFTRMRESLPGTVDTVEFWPGLLAAAGLEPTGSRTFLVDLPAPLGPDVRRHLSTELERARDVLSEVLDAEDLAVVDRLLDPDDEAGLLRRPDVFLLAARTVHTARAV